MAQPSWPQVDHQLASGSDAEWPLMAYDPRGGGCHLCTAVGTIKSRVHRARTRLSELLAIDNADRFGPDHTTRAILTIPVHPAL